MATSNIPQVTNDSGSNYCKMSDGTMIQWGVNDVQCDTNGGVFGKIGSGNFTFPKSFASRPVMTCNIEETAGFWNATIVNITTTGFAIWIAGDNTIVKPVYWIAIGRWK